MAGMNEPSAVRLEGENYVQTLPTPVREDEETTRDKQREKYRRYYERHKDKLREEAHKRYYLRVHNIQNPPPLRTNMKITQPRVPEIAH